MRDWGNEMRRFLPVAVALSLTVVQPALAQQAVVSEPEPQRTEAPIAVTPGSMAAGSAAGAVVVLLAVGVVAVALSSF
jgi:hypothetical protein